MTHAAMNHRHVLDEYRSDKSNEAHEAAGKEEGHIILQLHVMNLADYTSELISNPRMV